MPRVPGQTRPGAVGGPYPDLRPLLPGRPAGALPPGPEVERQAGRLRSLPAPPRASKAAEARQVQLLFLQVLVPLRGGALPVQARAVPPERGGVPTVRAQAGSKIRQKLSSGCGSWARVAALSLTVPIFRAASRKQSSFLLFVKNEEGSRLVTASLGVIQGWHLGQDVISQRDSYVKFRPCLWLGWDARMRTRLAQPHKKRSD